MTIRVLFNRLFPKRKLGMQGKLILGFVTLALILFLSSIIAVFEYRHMNDYVSDKIAENINCINTAHKMVNICDDYNMALLTCIGDDDMVNLPSFNPEIFTDNYDYLRGIFKKKSQIAMADSVRYAFVAYMLAASEIKDVWVEDSRSTRTWYYERLQPIYRRLRGYIDSMSELNYTSLRDNSATLQESFYRSIMPGVIAVGVGILIVILFLYFILSKYVRPLKKMLLRIQEYERFGTAYNYSFEDSDELSSLNNEVSDIIEQNISYRKRFIATVKEDKPL